MPTNDYLPFANDPVANVLTQPEYLAMTDRLSGVGAGLLPSVKLNKILRQTSVMTTALANAIVALTGVDLLDDGDVEALRIKLQDALVAVATSAGTGGVTIDSIQTQVDLLNQGIVDITASSATTRTFALIDSGVVVRRTAASGMTDTIPANGSVAFPIGVTITIRAAGAGSYALTAADGVTLNVPAGALASARGQGSTLMIHKVGTNEWDLTGDLTAA